MKEWFTKKKHERDRQKKNSPYIHSTENLFIQYILMIWCSRVLIGLSCCDSYWLCRVFNFYNCLTILCIHLSFTILINTIWYDTIQWWMIIIVWMFYVLSSKIDSSFWLIMISCQANIEIISIGEMKKKPEIYPRIHN